MAEIDPVFLKCVVYLYPSSQAAKDGAPGGGSGFVISYPLEPEPWSQPYVVTAAHLIEGDELGKHPVLRINSTAGPSETFPTRLDSWFIENDDDLAILPIDLPPELDIAVVPTTLLMTEQMMIDYRFGPGNEVFIVGRFVQHEGKERNLPTVRFGNISMMPSEPIKSKDGQRIGFLVEFRSIGGYSGSPVFMCEPPFHLPQRGQHIKLLSKGQHILGIDVGHMGIPERVIMKDMKTPVEPPCYSLTNTAMAVVIPAWRLTALLNRKDVSRARNTALKRDLKRVGQPPRV